MCNMIESLVNNINQKDSNLNIQNAWQNIIYNECIKARDDCLILFENEFKNQFSDEKALDFIEFY